MTQQAKCGYFSAQTFVPIAAPFMLVTPSGDRFAYLIRPPVATPIDSLRCFTANNYEMVVINGALTCQQKT